MSTDIDPGTLEGTRWDFYGVDNNKFCLGNADGKATFEVVEDESDGYRSSMETVRRDDGAAGVFSSAPIASVVLKADPVHDDDGDTNETWSLRDDDGHIWLTFGTNNTDDYYPYFVFNYSPKSPT